MNTPNGNFIETSIPNDNATITLNIAGKESTMKFADFKSLITPEPTPIPEPSYKVYTALLTQSGGDNLQYIFYDDNPAPTLTIGVTYYIDGGNLADFTNVGAPNNNDGTYFVATGTTPNSWGEATLTFNTGAPTVTVLKNTIGNIWFTYDSDGLYNINSNGLFVTDNTTLFIGTQGVNIISVSRTNTNLAEIVTYDISTATNSNNILSNTPIEIRVYN